MAENKGKFSEYNKMPVKQREYYYDVTDSGEPGKPSGEGTDKEIKKDFGDMMFDLKQVNIKVKEKLNKEKLIVPKKENK
jgi:hypothetical protein